MSIPGAETERLWEQLLPVIDEGHVIPIVGQDLLTARVNGRDVPLYSHLAERLAHSLGLPDNGSSSGESLSAVAGRFRAGGGKLKEIYPCLNRVMAELGELALPEALVKLADIRPFMLFVTTTFDPLLERAIDQVRFGGRSTSQIIVYTPQEPQDLPCEMRDLQCPTVFHLFGRLSSTPYFYAVTEEDILEFMHSLQWKERRPSRLFDELRKWYLLLIGCSFPDWLARFFLRIAADGRLSAAAGGKTDVIADRRAYADTELVFFLTHFSEQTTVFPGSPIAFVDELHRRWRQSHPAIAPAVPPEPEPSAVTAGMERGAVFISYASEDRSAVERIERALSGAGIPVWFDRRKLEIGDRWRSDIKKAIERASLFLAVLSRHSLDPSPREFRWEWSCASEVAEKLPPSRRFVLPLIIDDTAPHHEDIPEQWRDVHVQISGASEFGPTPDFVDRIRELYRSYQKATSSAA